MTFYQRFKSIEERFSEKYSVQLSGCWEWKAGRRHPNFWIGDKYQKASRYIWERTHNVRLATDQHVCHTCDNPICVNPDHLFLGSHLDNMQDKAAKGRASRLPGSSNGRAKMNESCVVEARCLYQAGGVSQAKLAEKYGITQQVMSLALRGVTWR